MYFVLKLKSIENSKKALLFIIVLFLLLIASFPYIVSYSKVTGKIKSDEFIDWANEKVQVNYDTTTDKELREKLKKELKARGLRNKQKRTK